MASSKNCTEVLIGGKVFTLSGFESEEYLQKVIRMGAQAASESAAKTIQEIRQIVGFR